MMQVKIRGRVYESVPKAAKKLKVAPSTIYSALTRGHVDAVGLGSGNRTTRRGGRPKKPITLAGITFASWAEAARALGYKTRAFNNVIARQNPISMERLIGQAMVYRARLDAAARKDEDAT